MLSVCTGLCACGGTTTGTEGNPAEGTEMSDTAEESESVADDSGEMDYTELSAQIYSDVLWGSDYERYHQALVCTEFITAEDRAKMKEKWNELRGTGTYEEWAKSFLTEKGYTLKSDYTLIYSANPTSWDVLSTYLASDSAAIANTYDGLYEYDVEL